LCRACATGNWRLSLVESMVERVARAIDGDLWQALDSYCRAKEWTSAEVAQEKMTRHVMQASFLRARAAIDAMRAVPEHLAADLRLEGQHIAAYHDIIDAALNEQVSG